MFECGDIVRSGVKLNLNLYRAAGFLQSNLRWPSSAPSSFYLFSIFYSPVSIFYSLKGRCGPEQGAPMGIILCVYRL